MEDFSFLLDVENTWEHNLLCAFFDMKLQKFKMTHGYGEHFRIFRLQTLMENLKHF